jgi:RNA polymerase sigma factor (sigma-70 family)
MTPAHCPPILRHIRRLVAGPQAAAPDRDLLRGYLECRDEAAFAALVERHGPMVLGVCRSVLRHRHDAEDAFQATFLVLARKAQAIRRPDGLASWLHGVAYRLALKARASAARRQALEQAAPAPAPSADDLSWGEVRTILHAELAALPERFRAPLVLCYLQGLTQDEAARRLGWSATTVKGRLQRGRDLLRGRLERRGLGLVAALGAVALTGEALARSMPPELAAAAARAALSLPGEATGGTAAALARGALCPSAATKLSAVAAALLVAVTLAGGVVLFPQRPADGGSAAEAKPAAQAPGPRADHHGDPLPQGAVARLGTMRFNHGDSLNALYYSPDGKTVISEGSGFVRIWDAATGKELRHFATAAPSFDDQTVPSPDGKTMTFLNQENDGDTLRVWDLARGTEVRVLQLTGSRNEISVSRRNALAPDGRLCAVHTRQDISMFDAATGRELYKLPEKGDDVRAVVFAGNDRLVTTDKKRNLAIWEARTGKLVRRFAHDGPVEQLVASADGRRLATLEHHTFSIDRLLERDVVHVWDLSTGTQQHVLAARPKRWYTGVRFSPDGKLLFASSYSLVGGELTVWETATGKRLHELAGASVPTAVSPDGSRLAARASLGQIALWDLRTGRFLADEDSKHAVAARAAFSPAGDRMLTIGWSSISTWDSATGRRLRSFATPPDEARAARLSPDGRYVLTCTGDWEKKKMLLWDVSASRRLHALGPPDISGRISGVFSPGSDVLATWYYAGKENVIRLWDVRAGKELRSFKDGGASWPAQLSFTADGKTLIVAGLRTVGLDVATGKVRFSWRVQPLKGDGMKEAAVGGRPEDENNRLGWRALAVAPDGALVACVLAGGGFGPKPVEDRIVLCEGSTGKILRRWNDSGLASRWGEHLTFSRDGRLLATSDDNAVHVWEVATGKAVHTFRGHRSGIESLAFSANGRRLVSTSWDSTALIWDLPLASRRPGEKDVPAWWADLLSADAGLAYAALWRLADAPAATVPFLRERLKPAPEDQMKQIRRSVADLGSATFAVRQKAFTQLQSVGPAAEPALREALAKDLPLEVRRRLEQLLEGAAGRLASGDWLRTLRALAALEYAGTPEARRLLRELAAGAQGAWLTREAQAACERLERQAVSK